jgi:hypothetical protein
MPWFMLLSLLFVLSACAPFTGPPVPPPLTPAESDQLVTLLREQDQRVRSFFWSGRLTARKRLGQAENLIVSVGLRDPLRLKIEITQSWGQPIAQALISVTQAKVLVVPEKRFYVGHMKESGLSGDFFPAGLDARQLWGALRGFPILPEYAHVISNRGDQLTFLDIEGKVIQTVDFDSATRLPRLVSLPDPVVNVSFAGIKDDQGVLYARHIIIESPDAGLTLELEMSQAIFNQPVPEAIFSLNPPLDYEIHPLP